ncbi:hypothetical protein NUW54_g5890 [Trametes sanguinea]|uniref:Uncharacterized protein n=1 Tax=Trametes sanguinea TaxID=158606 RepID=A0ACC1PWI0_9APHY|nr:hypothetical protein NUW54_g5890 [Trametes sanguinea]
MEAAQTHEKGQCQSIRSPTCNGAQSLTRDDDTTSTGTTFASAPTANDASRRTQYIGSRPTRSTSATNAAFVSSPIEPVHQNTSACLTAAIKLMLLNRTKGKVVLGGEIHKDKSISPTILTGVPEDDILMDEEIFAPFLPIIAVDDIDHAIRVINSKPIPLVIYLFTNQEELKNKFLLRTRSGQLVLNDTMMQLVVHEMPFGGQGESGYGMWFGKTSFDVFTHFRGVINVPNEHEPFLQARYRPYTQDKYEWACGPSKVKIPDA